MVSVLPMDTVTNRLIRKTQLIVVAGVQRLLRRLLWLREVLVKRLPQRHSGRWVLLVQLPSLLCIQRLEPLRPTGLLVASADHLVWPSFSPLVTPSYPVHSSIPPLRRSVSPINGSVSPIFLLWLDVHVDSPRLRLVERVCPDTWHDYLRVC